MTPRRRKFVWIGGIFLAVLAALIGVSLIIVRTQWFSDFVRAKIIATLEDSTGGDVELGRFHFEPTHLTILITDLVIHGTEAKIEEPLARIKSLELRLKLFAGLRTTLDFAYLGINEPRINVVVNPDGSNNIPEPKVKRAASSESPLATIVDLAVGEFRVENGLITYSQRKAPFSVRGDNLKVLLIFNSLSSRYQGFVRIDAKMASKGNQPLLLHVNLPLEMRRDGLSLTKGQLDTEFSHVVFSASLDNPSTPIIAATVSAKVFVPEIKRALDLPIASENSSSLAFLTADLDTKIDQGAGSVTIQHLRLALGNTTFDAAGTANSATGEDIQFYGNVAVAELSRLFKVSSPRVAGDLLVKGNAGIDNHKNYAISGTINSRGLAIAEAGTHLSNVSLSTPFHITPDLISLETLRLGLLGGELSANVVIQEMQKFSAEGQLHNISLSALCSALAGHPIDYGAFISGRFAARNDRKLNGTSVVNAETRLSITPGPHGVPVSGLVDASYAGTNELIRVKNAYINLPASRITISGSANKSLNVALVSRNLNDFLPVARFGHTGSIASLPVALKGGEARLDGSIQGDLSAPRIAGHAGISKFAAQNHLFDELSFDFAASPNAAVVQNASLRRNTMQAAFDGSLALVKWNPVGRSRVSANLTIRNADLGDLLALAGTSSPDNSGSVQGDIHIDGTYGDPLGSASVQLSQGMALGQPFDRADARVNLTHQLITLTALELNAAGGKVALQGTFQHRADRFTTGHADIHLRSSGVRLSQIVQLQRENAGIQGIVALSVDAAANIGDKQGESQVQISSINGDASANGLRIRNQDAGNLTASARTSSGDVIYTVKSNFAGSSINVDGRTSLGSDYTTKASAVIRNLPVQRALEVTGQGDIPVAGLLTADATVSGNSTSPDATLQLELTKASIYEEPVNRLTAKVQYRNNLLDLPLFDLAIPAGRVSLTGRYDYPDGSHNGSLQLRVNSNDLDAAKVKQIQRIEPGIGGKLKLAGEVAANVRELGGRQQVQVSSLNADVSAAGLSVANRKLGDLNFSARSKQSNVTFRFDSDLAQSEIHASGTSQLVPDYPTHAEATFKNVRYENIAPLLDQDSLPFDALVEGKASIDGPVLNANSLAARLELGRVEISSNLRRASSAKVVGLRNDQPIVIALDKQVVNLQRFSMRGDKTSVNAAGTIDLANAQNPLRFNVAGNLDLGVLREIDRDFYSSGTVALDANVAGTLNQPVLNGQLALQNANINYADAPNGISNANGVILLSGSTAAIKSLIAESGGGRIEISGSAGFSPRMVYNVRANAIHVRTRYAGASITSSANVTLRGNSRRSVLSGTVSVERIAYSTSSDIGSLLSSTSSPPSTPEAPTPLLAGMRLDVHITTASDLRVSTTYVEKIAVTSDLRLGGTAAQPGLLGRVTVTDGQLVFFGNTYEVNTGSINFYDASSVNPELDLSLETIAQGVDVTLGVKGPVNNMKLSYRSDPPLSFEQIVQLLATNTTPFDPTIAAHQPSAPQQSMSQMGESQALGQAIANPLASRVQRVFGLTQFKIDPSVAGNNGQPTAKITLRQKITNNLTFTYITDVTQTNSEIVRVQWDLNPKTSAVALRDYNGNVSVQLFYKFQIR